MAAGLAVLVMTGAGTARADEMKHVSPETLAWAATHMTPRQVQDMLVDMTREECPHQAEHALRNAATGQLGSNGQQDLKAHFEAECFYSGVSSAREVADAMETKRFDAWTVVRCLDSINVSYDWFKGASALRVWQCAFTGGKLH